jgi:hypothetical protein
MASPTAPIISATGIAAPTFAQVYAYLQGQYAAIFGADALVTPDTQDGQLLAVFAQAITDANAACVAVYNSFSPATAQGAGLSSNVQINGLTRLVPSASVALLTISGTPNVVLPNNSSVIDPQQNVWLLAPSSTIGPTGIGGALATCQTLGAIGSGLPANGFTINTPTFGWTGVINQGITVGAPVETDAALRSRQAQSVSLPSLTIFEGIVASIAQVVGVTRVKGYENNTSSGLSLSGGAVLPANNLLFVVEGGAALAIGNAIFAKITPGIPTWNSGGGNNVSQTLTDANGSTRLINFQTAIENFMSMTISVHPLSGWSPITETLITSAVNAYFAALPIGSNISYFGLINVIALPNTPQAGTFEITGLILTGGTTDQQLPYNYAPQAGSITYNLT